jgi:hypothetical protein
MAFLTRALRAAGRSAAGLAALAILTLAAPAFARVLMSQDEALKLAFPPPIQVARRTIYLDDAAMKRVRDAGAVIETRVVPYYTGTRAGAVTGYAFFDTHLVRTLPETVMIRLRPDGAIAAIDIVSFDEPDDYRTTARWREQFDGIGASTSDFERIRPLTGATLSARAVTEAARRVAVLYRLFVAGEAPGAVR